MYCVNVHAENDITCLTYKSESQHSFIAVCTDDGKTSLYDTERLHELCKVPTNQVQHTSNYYINFIDIIIINDHLRMQMSCI